MSAALLAGCGSERPPAAPETLRVHRDTAGLGQVLRLGPTRGWTFRWAGVPLSDPQGLGPTDLVVAAWAVPSVGVAAGSDSTVLDLPVALADSLLPEALRKTGAVDAQRWSRRCPRVDCPWKSTTWYDEPTCAALGEGVVVVARTR